LQVLVVAVGGGVEVFVSVDVASMVQVEVGFSVGVKVAVLLGVVVGFGVRPVAVVPVAVGELVPVGEAVTPVAEGVLDEDGLGVVVRECDGEGVRLEVADGRVAVNVAVGLLDAVAVEVRVVVVPGVRLPVRDGVTEPMVKV
jgi:hypothetical protein